MSEKKERKRRQRETQDRAARTYREQKRLLNAQRKAAATRAKYGPNRRPAPVVVRSLETGDVLAVKDQSRYRPREYSEFLNELARKAGYESYAAYVRSPYWLALRERVLDRDRRRCRRCGAKSNLSVHHDRYDFLGEERMKFLKTICARCHRRIHR